MRGLRLLVLAVSFAGVVVVACSSFDGDSPVVDDAGPDATLDGPAVPVDSGAPVDAGRELDADADASDMVAISAGRTYLIDRTEVTFAAYTAFADAVVSSQDAGFPSIEGCHFKTVIGPGVNCTPATGPTDPMTCVDWCDAAAYCKFRGKRLCGAINGGQAPNASANDPLISQWTRACSNSIVASGYPYGPDSKPNVCNTIGNTQVMNVVAPVGSFPQCAGGVPGLYDMSGNVEEWSDACNGTANGGNDTCVVHGGSFAKPPAPCNVTESFARADYKNYRGFRCCKDVP